MKRLKSNIVEVSPEVPSVERRALSEWKLQSLMHREKLLKLREKSQHHIQEISGVCFCCSSDCKIGIGNGGTEVFVGIGKDGTEKAVKRMLKGNYLDLANHEKNILLERNTVDSKYTVKYWLLDDISSPDFVYLILNLCEETLEDFVQRKHVIELKQEAPNIISDVLHGLADLHQSPKPIIHRDLKPQNILRNTEGRWLLADFGISRTLEGENSTTQTRWHTSTECWKAAEAYPADDMPEDSTVPYQKRSDIQVAGMVAYYVVTKGKHPFGERRHRLRNLLDGKPIGLDTMGDYVLEDLLSWMLSREPENRPYAAQALKHPYLLPPQDQFELLHEMGNEIKHEFSCDVAEQLNRDRTNWKLKISKEVYDYLRTVEKTGMLITYGSEWTECLRFIRHCKQHWGEKLLPRPKELPDEPHKFFLKLFPKLPVEVHKIVRNCDWKNKLRLQTFFDLDGTLGSISGACLEGVARGSGAPSAKMDSLSEANPEVMEEDPDTPSVKMDSKSKTPTKVMKRKLVDAETRPKETKGMKKTPFGVDMNDASSAKWDSVSEAHPDVMEGELGYTEEHLNKLSVVRVRSLALQFMSKHPSCLRVIPCEDNEDKGTFVVYFYVYTDGKGIASDLKAAAEEFFKSYILKFIDLQQRPLPKLLKRLRKQQKVEGDKFTDLAREIEKNLSLFENRLNVTAVEPSFKIADFKETNEMCVRIYVLGKGKIPLSETNFSTLKKLKDYSYDVVEGYYLPTNLFSSNKAQCAKVSIGVEGFPESGGTLGGFLTDENEKRYILSSNHVLNPDGRTPNDRYIVQPAEYDFSAKEAKIKKKIKKIQELLATQRQKLELSDHQEQRRARIATYEDDIAEKNRSLQCLRVRKIGKYECGLKKNVNLGGELEVHIDAAVAELAEDEIIEIEEIGIYGKVGLYGENFLTSDQVVDYSEISDEIGPFQKYGRTTGFTFGGKIANYHVFANSEGYRARTGFGNLVDFPCNVYCNECSPKEQEVIDLSSCSDIKCSICQQKIPPSSMAPVWTKNCLSFLQTKDSFAKPGDSGSIVFDKKGRACAMIFGVLVDDRYNIALASPVEFVLKALNKRIGKTLRLWSPTQGDDKEATDEGMNGQKELSMAAMMRPKSTGSSSSVNGENNRMVIGRRSGNQKRSAPGETQEAKRKCLDSSLTKKDQKWFEDNMLDTNFGLRKEVKDYLKKLPWIRSFGIGGRNKMFAAIHLEITVKANEKPVEKDLIVRFGKEVESFVEYVKESKPLRVEPAGNTLSQPKAPCPPKSGDGICTHNNQAHHGTLCLFLRNVKEEKDQRYTATCYHVIYNGPTTLEVDENRDFLADDAKDTNSNTRRSKFLYRGADNGSSACTPLGMYSDGKYNSCHDIGIIKVKEGVSCNCQIWDSNVGGLSSLDDMRRIFNEKDGEVPVQMKGFASKLLHAVLNNVDHYEIDDWGNTFEDAYRLEVAGGSDSIKKGDSGSLVCWKDDNELLRPFAYVTNAITFQDGEEIRKYAIAFNLKESLKQCDENLVAVFSNEQQQNS